MSETSLTPFWIKFFTDAGIPAGEAANHAVTFTDHRIQKDMLVDLTKEYLNDMGISMMGDVIAILKHAKTVHAQTAREKALRGTAPATVTPTATSSPRRTTPASRIVGHYLGKDPEARPLNAPTPPRSTMSAELASRLGPTNAEAASPVVAQLGTSSQKEEVPVPKVRRVLPEHEGPYKVIMPQGTTEKTKKILEKKVKGSNKTSVFDRLGETPPDSESEPKVTVSVTGLGKLSLRPSVSAGSDSSVFSRLGGKSALKRPASSTIPDSDDEEDGDGVTVHNPVLAYAGVLKANAPKMKVVEDKKKKTVTLIQAKPVASYSPAPRAKASQKSAGILGNNTLADRQPITQRLGKPVVAQATTTTPATASPARKAALASKKKSIHPAGIKGRLGPQRHEVSSSTQEEPGPSPSNFTVTVTKTTSSKGITSGGVKGKVKTKGVFSRLGKSLDS